MCCHRNISSPILLKFNTNIQRSISSISNKLTNFCSDCLRNDVTVTLLLFQRTRFSRSASPRNCCHGNSKRSTFKPLPFSKFLYILRESHQIWLNYLSPSLNSGQETSRVVPNTPGRIGLTLISMKGPLCPPVVFLSISGTSWDKTIKLSDF